MSKKAVLITGAARRVGREIGLHLAQQGYDIALHYRRSGAQAKEVQKLIEAYGVNCILIQADLEDIKKLPDVIDAALSAFSHCNTLINNASLFPYSSLLESTPQDFAHAMRINLESPVFLTQAFAKRVQQGQVINMLDTQVSRNSSAHFFYLMAKKSLRDFTLMAAHTLAPNIRVNGICPGTIIPSKDGSEADYVQKLEKRLPLKRLASIESVCQTISWLMQCKSITGQMIYVDSGEHLL